MTLGVTPLHWAANTGAVGVVKVLLRAGANPLTKDSTGATLAVCAAQSEEYLMRGLDFGGRKEVIKG
ncbi:hypothetical protein K469DRAFT_716313 [Zopfia rhizophila CBS 207.26]|uniref:Uncharacterized protein n=1 Tax=Zopfia rhizophila CBS 207.26 TaxID=1314779 RepID=A0A6A6DJ75_9PEZI|nr:hypothetical protein K469DRAFT_716313 [Zopfia rhizophila CBS 207.26]